MKVFKNILLKTPFCDEKDLLSKHNIHQFYVHECQVQNSLLNLAFLLHGITLVINPLVVLMVDQLPNFFMCSLVHLSQYLGTEIFTLLP
jgi:hypothetical protein